jgi:hypothetical protein
METATKAETIINTVEMPDPFTVGAIAILA